MGPQTTLVGGKVLEAAEPGQGVGPQAPSGKGRFPAAPARGLGLSTPSRPACHEVPTAIQGVKEPPTLAWWPPGPCGQGLHPPPQKGGCWGLAIQRVSPRSHCCLVQMAVNAMPLSRRDPLSLGRTDQVLPTISSWWWSGPRPLLGAPGPHPPAWGQAPEFAR